MEEKDGLLVWMGREENTILKPLIHLLGGGALIEEEAGITVSVSSEAMQTTRQENGRNHQKTEFHIQRNQPSRVKK